MGNTWTCPFEFLFFFFLLFRFAFFLLLFCFILFFVCFFPGKSKKKQKQKNKSKKQKKKQQKCKWTSPFFPMFPPFWRFFFFPFMLLPVFFGFEVLLFDFPCVFLFFCFFFKFKNIRINYRGGHNLNPLNHALNVLRRDDWIYIRHIWNHQPKEVPPRVCNGCKSLVFNQIAWIFHRNSSS